MVDKFNKICVDGHTNPYKAITFEAKDPNGDIIYHTDCVMSLHEKHAFICLDAIPDMDTKAQMINSLTQGPNPLQLIVLSQDQIGQMSANA